MVGQIKTDAHFTLQLTDFETGREKAEVCIWRNQFWTSRHATSNEKEEGHAEDHLSDRRTLTLLCRFRFGGILLWSPVFRNYSPSPLTNSLYCFVTKILVAAASITDYGCSSTFSWNEL